MFLLLKHNKLLREEWQLSTTYPLKKRRSTEMHTLKEDHSLSLYSDTCKKLIREPLISEVSWEIRTRQADEAACSKPYCRGIRNLCPHVAYAWPDKPWNDCKAGASTVEMTEMEHAKQERRKARVWSHYPQLLAC